MRDLRAKGTSAVTGMVTEMVTGDGQPGIAAAEAPGKKGVIAKMKATAAGMVGDIKSRMGDEIIIGTIKLVKEDIKKGKIQDVESYIAKCKESLRPGTRAGNMIRNSGVTWEEVEAAIRQTLKTNFAGKI